MRVTFLGTGSPRPSGTRHGIGTLIEAGPHRLLFDTGRATLQRMHDCGISIADVTNVFYTHLHSDHISGFGDFWMTGWFACERSAPLLVFGPAGTQRFIDGVKEAHHFDLSVRPAYEAANAAGLRVVVEEFTEGVCFDRDGVVVIAFLVDHGPHVKPAYGFRVDHAGRSVVLSGDTTACESVVRYATGADVLIHELAGASAEELARNAQLEKILAIHTTPEQVGEICRRARPRVTLINHLSLWGITTDDVLDRIGAIYAGVVEIAEDRMNVVIGSEISLILPAAGAVLV
jgi:ribonuclease Z